ncbi:two-component regulator propeller domain-containing protein [Bacteroidota bacterium]
MARGIYKDSKGFMWLGTENGLYRYDGTDFMKFQYDPMDTTSISGNMIHQILFEDRSGNLWIGTTAGGLNIYKPTIGSFRHFLRTPEYPLDFDFNLVHTGVEDQDGTVWLASTKAAGILHLDPVSGEYSILMVNPDTMITFANRIAYITDDSKGRLWIGTYQGLYLFDKDSGKFTNIGSIIPEAGALADQVTNGFVEDSSGHFWITTSDALFQYNEAEGRIAQYRHDPDDINSISNSYIRTVFDNPLDNGKSLWLVTRTGLNRFEKATGRVIRYEYNRDDPRSKFFYSQFMIYLDEQGILWVATGFSGFVKLNLNSNPFSSYTLGPFGQETHTHEASTFLEDSKGNFWIGTGQGGLLQYDRQMNFKKRYTHDPYNPASLSGNFIFTLMEDSDDNLWVGTAGSLDRFERGSETFHHIELSSKIPYDFYRINDMLKDRQGHIWIANSGSLFGQHKEDIHTDNFYEIDWLLMGMSDIRAITEDSSGSLWFASALGDGLFRLKEENREEMKFETYKHDPLVSSSLSTDVVWSLLTDSRGVVWVGTAAGLNRFDPEKEQFFHFNLSNGLDAIVIYNISEDDRGDLWLSTEKGIMRFRQTSDSTATSRLLELSDGIPFDDNYHFKIYKGREGKIYVSARIFSGDGFYCFHPDSLRDNDHVPPVVITGFNVNNEPIRSDSAITEQRQLRLNHDQNFFSIRFAALDFIDPAKNSYAYILEGFDKDWIYSNNRRQAYYTNVPPGDYIFRVKGSNNDGLWNEEGTSLAITISPPPWRKWWAYTIYALLFIGLIFSWRRYDLKRQRLKQELEIEQVESEKLKELDTMKSRFFANISHEFRTPLTLILGPLENILKKTMDEETGEELNLMQRQAQRLLKLVNQLLSLSRLDAGKMQIQAREENITALVSGFVQSFESLAKQKEISLSIDINEKEILAYVDVEKLEQIINNLMSNALKFTSAGGRIVVSMTPLGPPLKGGIKRGVTLEISDTGPGIPPDKLPFIFDRFYQVDDSETRSQEGTGIGLALVKQLVELHHGSITVESEIEKGTTFTVILPLGKEHLKQEEIVEMTPPNLPLEGREMPPPDSLQEREGRKTTLEPRTLNLEPEGAQPLLLLVEDNTDLRAYMRKGLEQLYQIEEAVNGKDGFENALKHIPDLIVSDVMMPEMDGNELSRKLKSDERTSHIPVILLTAKASKESKMEGLQTGADDFITKPFDQEELLVRIKNLIDQRNRLREIFSATTGQERIISGVHFPEGHLGELDAKFLRKAVRVVEENLSDFDFTVEKFGQEMAVSRVQLHRKLKALTAHSATEVIRTIRLEHAADLLKKGSGNVTEVAYDVGFNNLSWFARCFQEMYHVPPSEYGKKS